MAGKYIWKASVYLLLAVLCAVFLFPFIVTLTNSFMSAFEVTNRYTMDYTVTNNFDGKTGIHFAEISLIPNFIDFAQYIKLLFSTTLYLGLFFNSVKLVVPIVIGQLLVSVPAAYAIEMSENRFKEVFFFIYILIMLLPLQVTIVPNFIMAQSLSISGNAAIILPAVFSPFGVFLVRQFMKGLPRDYVEAAQVDGAGAFRIFLQVIFPIIKPAAASLAMLVFVEHWNMVDQAVVFIKESVNEPMSVYLSRLTTDFDMDIIFAASCFYMLPAVLIFLFGKEYMIEGIQLSGIK